ncbi:MAG: Hint domain-containing protein [Paracoccaceae bacterium]
MPQTNVIVNGDFNLGNTGWGGTDLETNYTETAYLGNNSTNRVAEMDGTTGQITVMTQSVTVTKAITTNLTFRTALRTMSQKNAGTEGFKVEVLNAQNQVIGTQTFLPTSTAWVTNTMSVTFPTGGTYTIKLTELGPNDSLGAIIDDVGMLICFTAGTQILTADGARAVETLTHGDLIWTLDDGMQPLRWIGQRTVGMAELLADRALHPITFAPGSLGGGLPQRTMALSPQHRVCLGGWQAELHFGQSEVLVSAQSLVNGTTITRAMPTAPVTYVHFLLDGHQIVRSDGVLTESFFPTALSLSGLDRAARDEVLGLFPDLASLTRAYAQTARPVLRGTEVRMVA